MPYSDYYQVAPCCTKIVFPQELLPPCACWNCSIHGHGCQAILAKRRPSPTKNILAESAALGHIMQPIFAKVVRRLHYKEGVLERCK
jgi:hypothetical protein